MRHEAAATSLSELREGSYRCAKVLSGKTPQAANPTEVDRLSIPR